MSTSGVFTFNPEVADHIDEAWERVGKDPAKLTAKELISARRSMNYMQVEWSTLGITLWTIKQESITLTQGEAEIRLSENLIYITDAVLRRDDVDVPMSAMARDEYTAIVNKSEQGRPDRFYLDRDLSPTVTLWQAPENSTDVFMFWGLYRTESVVDISQNPEIPYRYYDAFAAGLAARLAEKYAPEREANLFLKSEKAIGLASDADRERTNTTILPPRRRR